MKIDWKSRIKNYGFWISFAALVPVVCQLFGLDILPNNFEDIVKTVLVALMALGIINDNSGTGYTDTPKEVPTEEVKVDAE